MDTTKANTSKVLLIILGVLVALVIGFSSNVGAKGLINWNKGSESHSNIQNHAKDIFEKSSTHLSKKVIDFFAVK